MLLLTLTVIPLMSACSNDAEPTTPAQTTEPTTPAQTTEPTTTPTATTPTPEPEVAEFEIVHDAVADYLADRAGNIKAADLNLKIAEGEDIYIVSLRNAEDYAKGHIPGAVNMAFDELATLSEDEEIVVYCYTGQSASFGAAVLGTLGYDVQNLLHGFSSWSTDPDIYVTRFDPETSQGDYQVETTANEAETYELPELENTTSNDADEIVKAAALTVSPKYITAADLNLKIAEDEDMTIVSVRSAEHYAAGHIPGAINIELDSLAENIAQLDPDAPVYVYCYTGHSAAQATALLQMLGYDAYSVKFGMCGWSADETVNAGKCFDASGVSGYEVEQ